MTESPSENITDTVTEAVAPVIDLVGVLLVVGIGGALALGLHLLVVRIAFRRGRGGRLGQELRTRCRWPSRVTTTLVGMLAAVPFTGLGETWRPRTLQVLTIAIIVSGALTAIRAAEAVEAAVLGDVGIDTHREDLPADQRRRQTQATLLRRAATALIVILTIGGVLLTFDAVRSVGTSLLASAGVIGLVAGIAAQNTLGNLIAGIQIAFAEPMQLGDVVIVENEWGNVEEITLTYVVVRIWDRRRLVLPTSYFVQTPFQNWTRTSSQVVGVVLWHLDHRTPVAAMRAEFHRLLEANPLWDGEVGALLVVDTDRTTIHVRATMTAATAHDAWYLRCEIREQVIAWLRDHHPEALPSTRLLEAAPDPDGYATPPVEERRGAVPAEPETVLRDIRRAEDAGGEL